MDIYALPAITLACLPPNLLCYHVHYPRIRRDHAPFRTDVFWTDIWQGITNVIY